ncbi:hypothetical protein GCM10027343_37000 [Noviherbaspirillum agri]
MSAKRIQQLTRHFLEGGFINIDTQTELYEFLEDNPSNVDLVNQLLGGIGVKIVHTSNGRTWYPAYLHLDDITRKQIEETVVENKRRLRHLVSFFRLTLAATGGAAPQGGVAFRVSTMSEVIHSNSSLVDTLKLLCSRLTVNSDTVQGMTNAVIKWAERQDLIKVIDPAHGEYRFSGKVDWINDMVNSFDECIERQPDQEAPENMRLF